MTANKIFTPFTKTDVRKFNNFRFLFRYYLIRALKGENGIVSSAVASMRPTEALASVKF